MSSNTKSRNMEDPPPERKSVGPARPGADHPGETGRYFTTSQLARRWGVSVITIIRLIEQGDLKGLKIRGCYRISHLSIEEYESRVAF